jgi:uncharacterized protein YndB with AHSA1/START domain
MEPAMASRFVYATYIRTSPQKLWDALIKPEFTKRYFFGVTMDTDWQVGSPWKMVHADGKITDAGEVLEVVPQKRLVLKWRNEFPELKPEGYTRCTFELTPQGELTKLEVVHEAEMDNSKTINAISGGWPRILSNLKTFLETGEVLAFPSR